MNEQTTQQRPVSEQTTQQRLWIGAAYSPYNNPYGLLVVLAATREEAVSKARAKLEDRRDQETYVPARRYVENLLQHLDDPTDGLKLVEDGVVIDWAPIEKRR